MRLNPILLATCLTAGSWWAVAYLDGDWKAQAAPAARSVTPPPAPPAPMVAPISPAPPPIRETPPEMAEAFEAMRIGEPLIMAGRLDEAIENYRRAFSVRYANNQAAASSMHGVHLQMLATRLIRDGRSADAEPLLRAYNDGASDELRASDSMSPARIIDIELYVAADRRDVDRILTLIDRRSTIRNQVGPLRCPEPPYFPMVLAPMHHDERVAAALGRIGCDQTILDQVDRLAAGPIGDVYPLPPRD